MNKELAKTLTTALVQFIDRERPEGTMCCSNGVCATLEKAFVNDDFDRVEELVKYKLSGLTEFEQELVNFYNKRSMLPQDKDGVYNRHDCEELLHESAKTLLAFAKKELLSYADESNPAIEAMADLERTFECNPDKLPKWLKNELTKKHMDGYIMGIEDTMREMKDFIESHFNTQSGTATAKVEG